MRDSDEQKGNHAYDRDDCYRQFVSIASLDSSRGKSLTLYRPINFFACTPRRTEFSLTHLFCFVQQSRVIIDITDEKFCAEKRSDNIHCFV